MQVYSLIPLTFSGLMAVALNFKNVFWFKGFVEVFCQFHGSSLTHKCGLDGGNLTQFLDTIKMVNYYIIHPKL